MKEKKLPVIFLKRPDDPTALRISMGWGLEPHEPDQGYIVYRGELSEIKKTFQKLYEAVMKLQEEAPPDPRDRWF